MNSNQMEELERRFGGGEPKREKQSPKKKYIRCKEAVEVYGMGRTKLTQLAREAGAVIKIDSTLLIDIKVDGTVLLEIEAFENYLDEHRVIEE